MSRGWWASPAARWSLLGVVVVALLSWAIWPRETDAVAGPSAEPSVAVDDAELTAARARAALDPCPAPGAAPAGSVAPGPLAGVRLDCLGDGRTVDLATALAGRPAVVNLWAWWCAPCRTELPALAEYALRAKDRVTVLGVHASPNPVAALGLVADIGIRFPSVADPGSVIAARLGLPQALPVTVLLRADGTVATVLPRPFADADDVAATVAKDLGVAV